MMIEIEIVINSILVGVILTTQFVSYPLFLKIDSKKIKLYHTFYTKYISYIVIPLMSIELFLNLSNLYHNITIYPRYYISTLALFFVWLSTILIQLPLHRDINFYYRKFFIEKLIKSNWIRTVLWSGKLLILIFIKEAK